MIRGQNGHLVPLIAGEGSSSGLNSATTKSKTALLHRNKPNDVILMLVKVSLHFQ